MSPKHQSTVIKAELRASQQAEPFSYLQFRSWWYWHVLPIIVASMCAVVTALYNFHGADANHISDVLTESLLSTICCRTSLGGCLPGLVWCLPWLWPPAYQHSHSRCKYIVWFYWNAGQKFCKGNSDFSCDLPCPNYSINWACIEELRVL